MATAISPASGPLISPPRRRLGELLSGRYSPSSVSLAISRAARGASWTARSTASSSATWRSEYPDGEIPRTSTWPKARPFGAASTHAAKASREAAATLVAPCASGASGKRLLRHRLAGAGGDEVRHRGVGADRGAVEDRLALARRHLAGQAEVPRDGFARVPALGDKDGDQDDVLRLDALHDLPDLRLLIQEPNLDQVVGPTLPDAPGVEVDDAPGVLVQVGAVPQEHERGAPRGLLAAHQVVRALEDDVGHPLEGSQGPRVADGLAPLLRYGSFEAELPRNDLLGEVPLGDQG